MHYRYPLPDLFVNSPLLVTGKYEGNSIPGDCHIEGLDSKGSKVSLPVRVEHSSRLPIDRIFLKQRIDLLTAKAWLEESKELEALVVRLSKEGEFPSAFTKLVAFETTAESLEQQADLETSRLEDDAGSFVESELVPEPDESKEDTLHSLLRPKRRRFGLSSRQLGLLAGGGAVVVGAAAFSFGNLAASLDNLAIGSLGAEGIADGGNCCDDCDMDDCGAC